MLEDLYRMRGSVSGSSQLLTRPLTLDHRPAPVTGTLTTAWKRTPIKIAVLVAAILLVAILLTLRFWHAPLHQPSAEAKTWYDKGLEARREGTYYQASKKL